MHFEWLFYVFTYTKHIYKCVCVHICTLASRCTHWCVTLAMEARSGYLVSSFIILHTIVYYYSDDDEDGNGDDADTGTFTKPSGMSKNGWSTSLGEAGL